MSKFMILGLYIILFQVQAQNFTPKNEKAIVALINSYSLARENRDSVSLSQILTQDIDQLVSNGEWRSGIEAATKGMQRSSANNGGKRTLTVDKIRFPHKKVAIADARYEIENADGTSRKMWSTFVVVQQKGEWKISAIRNMLPAR